MSKTLEALIGYGSLPFILAHVMVGFLLMIATVFMGIPDLIGMQLHALVGFPIFVVAVGVWGLGVLGTFNYLWTGSFGLGGQKPDFRLTFLGVVRRFIIACCCWLIVLALLSLIPATRSVMIQPLALVGRPAIPLTIWLMHDRNPRVRRAAIDVLRNMGAPAKSAAPEIIPYLNDPDEQVRLAASGAIRWLDPSLEP